MVGMWKGADFSPSSAAPPSATAPLPQIEVKTTPASGKRGPVGTSPRTNYSRVNTGAPPVPDAGASTQKAVPPPSPLPEKVAFSHEGSMATMTARPRLQDMVKAAMVRSIKRVDITKEAARQANYSGLEKLAEDKCPKCDKPESECRCPPEKSEGEKSEKSEKKASADYARKLASAVEYIVETISKEAKPHASDPPPGVSQATATETLPLHQGQAHHQPPMNPGLRKGLSMEKTPTQLDNDLDHAPGGNERMVLTNYGKKTSSAVGAIRAKLAAPDVKAIYKATKGSTGAAALKAHMMKPKLNPNQLSLPFNKKSAVLRAIRTKLAEDALSPAKFRGGKAVPPESSAAGESGGSPAGGPAQGPTNLVGSNESAMNFKRNAAYANRKQDLKKYVSEPAMSSATDKTLAQAFNHTSEAGTKFSSADVSIKTAAAKALIAQLADEASAEVDRRSA